MLRNPCEDSSTAGPAHLAGPAPKGLQVRSLIRAALAVCSMVLPACQTQSIRVNHRQLISPSDVATLDQESPFLKAHLRNGEVYVLSEWKLDPERDMVTGKGRRLGVNREQIEEKDFTIPVSSVALFETNVLEPNVRIRSLAVMTGISAAVTAGCALSPKSCFGSCPTFYVADSESSRPVAEGFSSSIAPALEADDVDALFLIHPTSRELEIRVTNEALETHVIRYVDLLAVPRPRSGRVFAAADGTFRAATEILQPLACRAASGDCLDQVEHFDGSERFTTTDRYDLGRKEIIELEFLAPPNENVGLVIGARQTFVSTYLFYQTLASLGRSAGASLAAIERGDRRSLGALENLERRLDRIEVLVEQTPGRWTRAGEFREQGPIAADVQLVPLGRLASHPLRVRLRLVRGMWRIDYLALARLAGTVEPTRISPYQARSPVGADEIALGQLVNRSGITTLPSDEYTLAFRLPEDFERQELFLDTRGYYLEWLRQEWLAEESRLRAAMILRAPRLALRMLAPGFKKHEDRFETLFWSSRYANN